MNKLKNYAGLFIVSLLVVAVIVIGCNGFTAKADTDADRLDEIMTSYLQIQSKKLDLEIKKLDVVSNSVSEVNVVDENFGAVTPYIENYFDNINRNGKYYSALPIELTGTAGTLSVGGTLTVTGATTITGAIGAGVVVTDTFTQGGGVTATSTNGSAGTFLATAFDTENIIRITANLAAPTFTFTASSSLTSFIPTTGDHRMLRVENVSAVTSTTIAFGTGVTGFNASTTSSFVIAPSENAILHFWRVATGGDIEVDMIGTHQ